MFKGNYVLKEYSFRAALEWAETQTTPVLQASDVPWDQAEAAGPKLQDFLLQILDENALLLVDKSEYAENGWELWRLLVQQYTSASLWSSSRRGCALRA